MHLNPTPLIDEATLRARIAELGAAIRADYGGEVPLIVGVLKGALHFTSDLVRAIPGPLEVGFVQARSYEGIASTGSVSLSGIDEDAFSGRHVLLVEDILDTGRTLTMLAERIRAASPASLKVCTLLDKPSRRLLPFEADYTGFTIEDHFVVGYGLDHNERYRELCAIHVLEEEPEG